MLVCGSGLQHFFEMRHYLFSRVTIGVKTYVTKFVLEFCAIFIALPLLARYQICYY